MLDRRLIKALALICAPCLSWAQTTPTFADDCASVSTVPLASGNYWIDATQATTGSEGQNESLCDEFGTTGIANDVWFIYTPSTTGTVEFLACGFGPLTGGKIAIYPEATCPADGTAIGCDGMLCFAQGGGARVVLSVDHGVRYLVQVGSRPGDPPFVGPLFISENPGENYCTPAGINSTGLPGEILAFGSGDLLLNDLTLQARQLPSGQFGYFITSQTQGIVFSPSVPTPLCVVGNIGRFVGPGQVFTGPLANVAIDLGAMPLTPTVAVLSGETWFFQAWYRDMNPSPGTNFTNALSITFH